MPIYEYRCSKCNKVFEEWTHHFDSPEHKVCPECGGDAERIISDTTFILKGQGWYVTEYGNHKTDHESGAGAPGEGEKKPESTTESSTESGSEKTTEKAESHKKEEVAHESKESAESPSKNDTAAA